MSNARVSQPEYNYILYGQVRANENYPFVPVSIGVESHLARALKNPTFAVVTCWKHTMGRSGLSPFVLHYLLKEERTIDEYIKLIMGKNQKIWNYSYCGTTRLPVVSSYAMNDWDANLSFKLARYHPRENRVRDLWENNYIARQRGYRDDAEALGKVAYAEALRAPNVDEAMRTFYGSKISKAEWLHLKGVAGIYQ